MELLFIEHDFFDFCTARAESLISIEQTERQTTRDQRQPVGVYYRIVWIQA